MTPLDIRLVDVGMTRTALANTVGVTRASLHNWARRTRRVQAHHAAAMCEVLGVGDITDLGMIPVGSDEPTGRDSEGARVIAETPLLARIRASGFRGYSDYARHIGVVRPNVERWAKRKLAINQTNATVVATTLGLRPGEIYRLVDVQRPRPRHGRPHPVVNQDVRVLQQYGMSQELDKTTHAMSRLYEYVGTRPGSNSAN